MTEPGNMIVLGRIGAAHGIKGEIRIQSFTEDPLAIASYGPLATSRRGLTITIRSARVAGNVVVCRIEGVADRNAAETLNGLDLMIDRSLLPPLEAEDDFYHADLVGLAVRGSDGTVLGSVIAVQNFGADDLLEIRQTGGGTRLLPFTRAVVPQIDLASGYLVVEPPAEVEGELADGADDEGAEAP
ncbi:ribosome maturation factor RimM [Arsenicitalea aurantiaca]|uniref:Ribosome maturation factor RimM n=1 Tax=Arsenicitalea aurantiaca TaxID=1783274 RepID=A0A433X7I4_9HYPH|nr:ribosome maturation factor RimM [Arsenicitalea aurantiaca]RUT30036.1 ribosome maturation factor RimM [Arsenicitalea aurantiaca]